jgi:radical SAM protein with 4Fe4S-binding SPASM domain
MIEKVIEYIKDKRIINIDKLKKDLNLSDEEWELILLQLKDLGYIKKESLPESIKCSSCPFAKSCSQGCLQSGILYFVKPHKD